MIYSCSRAKPDPTLSPAGGSVGIVIEPGSGGDSYSRGKRGRHSAQLGELHIAML